MTGFATRLRTIAGCAVWAGAGWGLLEGIVLVAGRGFPAIQAAHKVPIAGLWIAPFVQIGFFLLASIPLAFLTANSRRALALFSGLGALAVLFGPGLLHWSAVVSLSVAAGVLAHRALDPARSARLAPTLAQPWLPGVALLLVAIATTAIGWATERRRESAVVATADSSAPDVIFLILDTVRRDRMSGGQTRVNFLGRHAQAGVTFSDAWATSSWSLPSQASILTGRTPQRHQADWPGFRLVDSVPTLAEAFRDRGYATGAFSSNDSWITPEYLGRGFGRFRTYRLRDVWRRTSGGRALGRALQTLGRRGDSPAKPMGTTADEFLDFAAAFPNRPIFGYLCFMDVNRAFYDRLLSYPFWQPKPPMAEGVASYDQELSRLDKELERMFAALKQRGRLENTIVVVTSDHGESFGLANGDHDPRGHGTSLYPEQVRVPLTIVAPGRLPPRTVVEHPVSLTGLAAFVTQLAGGADPRFPDDGLLGLDRPMDSSGLFISLDYSIHSARSIVSDHHQYIWNRGRAAVVEELFDLAADSLARNNLAPTTPAIGRFRALVERADPAAGSLAPR